MRHLPLKSNFSAHCASGGFDIHPLASPLRCNGSALSLLSAWDVAGRTPLGLLPGATPGCHVAASRCRGSGTGLTTAVPPPLDSSGGLPFSWFSVLPLIAWPRSKSSWRFLRGVLPAPMAWAPSTCSLGLGQGACAVIAPQLLLRHVLCVLQRHCGTAGGVQGDLAPPRISVAGMFIRNEFGHRGVPGYCGCCCLPRGRRCYRCHASSRRTPWPLAGSSDTVTSVIGLDTIATFLHPPSPLGNIIQFAFIHHGWTIIKRRP